ncbi:MAG TPA: hypothetical protein DD465_23115 [Thalassospira sp.]|nr:hypothetical protein [Thalassospira sp.]
MTYNQPRQVHRIALAVRSSGILRASAKLSISMLTRTADRCVAPQPARPTGQSAPPSMTAPKKNDPPDDVQAGHEFKQGGKKIASHGRAFRFRLKTRHSPARF